MRPPSLILLVAWLLVAYTKSTSIDESLYSRQLYVLGKEEVVVVVVVVVVRA